MSMMVNAYAHGGGGGGGGSPGPIPSFVAVGTIDSANAIASTISPGLPAGWAEDHIFVLITECNSADTVPAPGGWTEVTASPQSDATGTTSKTQVFIRRATSSETAPTVTRVGDHTVALIAGFSGCATSGDPVNAAAGGSGAGTSVTIPGVTTTVVNCLIVDIVGHGIDSSTGSRLSGWANAGLASPSITEAAGSDLASAAGGGGGMALAYGGMATAGAVGSTTATLNSSISWGAIKIALKPTNT